MKINILIASKLSEKLNIQDWEFVKSKITVDKFLQFQTSTKNYGFNPQEIILTFMNTEKKNSWIKGQLAAI